VASDSVQLKFDQYVAQPPISRTVLWHCARYLLPVSMFFQNGDIVMRKRNMLAPSKADI